MRSSSIISPHHRLLLKQYRSSLSKKISFGIRGTNNSNQFLDLGSPLTRRAPSPSRPPEARFADSDGGGRRFDNSEFVGRWRLKDAEERSTPSTADSSRTKTSTVGSSGGSASSREVDRNVAVHPHTPPDDQLKAWSAVFAGWICQFCSIGFICAFGVLQDEYKENVLKQEDPNRIAWITTSTLFFMFFACFMVGIMVDTIGPRKVLFPSSVLLLAGLCALSGCKEYYQFFLAQALCFGIGAAGVFMPSLVTVGQYFKRHRALALGIVTSGGAFGGVVFPIMLSHLFDKVGFASTIRWTALLVGISLIIANLLTDARLEPKGIKNLSLHDFFEEYSIGQPEYILFASGSFIFLWGLLTPFIYLPQFSLRVSPRLVTYIVPLISAGSIPGRIIPDLLADRDGSLPSRSMAITAFNSAATVLAIWLPVNYKPSIPGVIAFAVLYGVFSGAFLSLVTPGVISLCEGKTETFGSVLGTFLVAVALACVSGIPIQNTIAEKADGNFKWLVGFSGAAMMVGTAVISGAWWVRSRKGST